MAAVYLTGPYGLVAAGMWRRSVILEAEMDVCSSQPPLDSFLRRLDGASQAILALDYDGTLAPFRLRREEAVPYPGVRERLATLSAFPLLRLVLVSGRQVDELAGLAGLQPPLEAFGSHGTERLCPDGRRETIPLAPGTEAALDLARAHLAAAGWEGRLEAKRGCLAVHARGLAEGRRVSLEREVRAAHALPGLSGLRLLAFDGGLELRAPECDKGRVIRALTENAPHRTPIAYLGDDATDEDAFAALPPDGLGVLVSATERPSRAQVRICPPEELLAFFDAWIARLSR